MFMVTSPAWQHTADKVRYSHIVSRICGTSSLLNIHSPASTTNIRNILALRVINESLFIFIVFMALVFISHVYISWDTYFFGEPCMCEGQGPGATVANSRINPRFIPIPRQQPRRKPHGEREACQFPTIASLPLRVDIYFH